MVVYGLCYGAGLLFAASAHSCLSGASLLFAAVYLYVSDVWRTKNPLHLRALFSAFFVGGQGISCLRLSKLQTPWEPETWAAFFVADSAFWVFYELAERRLKRGKREEEPSRALSVTASGIFTAMALLTAVSLTAFLFEAAVLGYVPFFLRGVPHAYSYFHISGVHYVTVSCVLVPSMAVLYLLWGGKRTGGRLAAVGALTGISLLIPILCVSRFQLIFAVILAVLTYMTASGCKKIRYLFYAAAALIPLYVVLSIARSHDVAYLNGIFEMKDADTPIFITQPYMYIANNYDNFNCLVRDLPRHSLGLKGLFPLWALTGLKFLRPELVDWPIYTTKEELTTVTLFYDAYYDFGIVGVFLFAAVLGAAAAWLASKIRAGRNPGWYLLYAQVALYFMLSFFTTWYSNPTTWFYFAVTGAFAVFIDRKRALEGLKNFINGGK